MFREIDADSVTLRKLEYLKAVSENTTVTNQINNSKF